MRGRVGLQRHRPDADAERTHTRRSERIVALCEAIRCCRKGDTVSVMGFHGAFVDKFPMDAVVNKGLTLRSGQQHGQRYVERRFGHIKRGEMDPPHLLTHPMPPEQGPRGYDLFKNKKEGCVRAVLKP